jgi:altronate dehydratase
MKGKFIIMNPEDNCATSLAEIHEGEQIKVNGNNIITINQIIPFGHKFALRDINKGELIKKYGQIIGISTQAIKRGDWVHTHNIKSYYLEVVNK